MLLIFCCIVSISLLSIVNATSLWPQVPHPDEFANDLSIHSNGPHLDGRGLLTKRNDFIYNYTLNYICGYQQANVYFPFSCPSEQYCNRNGEYFQCCDDATTYTTTIVVTATQTSTVMSFDSPVATVTSVAKPFTSTQTLASYGSCRAKVTTCYGASDANDHSNKTALLCTDGIYSMCMTYAAEGLFSAIAYDCDTASYIMPVSNFGYEVPPAVTATNTGWTYVGYDAQGTLAGPTSSYSLSQSSGTPGASPSGGSESISSKADRPITMTMISLALSFGYLIIAT